MKIKFKIIVACLFVISAFTMCNQLNGKSGDPKNEDDGITAEDDDKVVEKPKQKLSPDQYVGWIENPENGMVKEKTIGDFSFTAFYTPAPYLVCKEFTNDTITNSKFNKKLSDFGEMQYISFRIESLKEKNELLKVGITSEDEYYARLEYFSFKMQRDFKLIEGKDTLQCALFHFERTYGLAPNATFVMGFPKGNTVTKSLLYEDKTFNVGNIFLRIKKQDLINLPIIQI